MNTPEHAESPYVPPVIDEGKDLGFWWGDVVLSILTLPLLFWAFMYAVSGNEKLYATRGGRLKVYAVLLVMEALIVAGIVWWISR